MNETRTCPSCGRDTLALLDGLDEVFGAMYLNWNCDECGYFELISESGHAYTYKCGKMVPLPVPVDRSEVSRTERTTPREYLETVRASLGEPDADRLRLTMDANEMVWKWGYELPSGAVADTAGVDGVPAWFSELPMDSGARFDGCVEIETSVSSRYWALP